MNLLLAISPRSGTISPIRSNYASRVAVALLTAASLVLVGCSGGSGSTAAGAKKSLAMSTTLSGTKQQVPSPPTFPPVSVPKVIGMTFRGANLALVAVNLGLSDTLVDSDNVDPGLVVSQNPPAGAVVPAMTAVALAISDGPAQPLVGPSCQTGNLRLDLGERVSEQTGQHTADLILTNTSRTTCRIFGYPTITLLDASGNVLPFQYSHQGDQMTTDAQPRVVSLRPGWAAYVRINKYRCDTHAEDTTARLRLALPGDRSPALGLNYQGISLEYCTEAPSSVVAISPFESTALAVSGH